MPRTILFPQELSERLDFLARIEQETNGVLFYQQRSHYCPIEALFMTGVGTEEHVRALPERSRIVNIFLKRNKAYKFVKFHTHTIGTIHKHGNYYAKYFSTGDLELIKKELHHSSSYIALLATPDVQILSGIDNPQLQIVADFPAYKQRQTFVETSLHLIAKEIGHPLGNLEALLRK